MQARGDLRCLHDQAGRARVADPRAPGIRSPSCSRGLGVRRWRRGRPTCGPHPAAGSSALDRGAAPTWDARAPKHRASPSQSLLLEQYLGLVKASQARVSPSARRTSAWVGSSAPQQVDAPAGHLNHQQASTLGRVLQPDLSLALNGRPAGQPQPGSVTVARRQIRCLLNLVACQPLRRPVSSTSAADAVRRHCQRIAGGECAQRSARDAASLDHVSVQPAAPPG